MDTRQINLLALIKKEYREYCLIPDDQRQRQRDKQQFIQGLMIASRVTGITYEALNDIVNGTARSCWQPQDIDQQELDVPTYLRQNLIFSGWCGDK